jgi:hypothetical protein
MDESKEGEIVQLLHTGTKLSEIIKKFSLDLFLRPVLGTYVKSLAQKFRVLNGSVSPYSSHRAARSLDLNKLGGEFIFNISMLSGLSSQLNVRFQSPPQITGMPGFEQSIKEK